MQITTKKLSQYSLEVYVNDEKDALPMRVYKLAGVSYNDELTFTFDVQPNIDYDMVDGVYIEGDIYVKVPDKDLWEPCTKYLSNEVIQQLEEYASTALAHYESEYILDKMSVYADRMEDR